MNNQFVRPLLPFLAVLLLNSSSCCRTESCQTIGLPVLLQGFDSTDVDTLFVKRYAAGTGFAQAYDSEMTAAYVYNGRRDTLAVSANPNEQYDVEIDIPALGRRVLFDQLTYLKKMQQVCGISMDKVACYSPVATYRMDGVVYSIPDSQQYSNYAAVITK